MGQSAPLLDQTVNSYPYHHHYYPDDIKGHFATPFVSDKLNSLPSVSALVFASVGAESPYDLTDRLTSGLDPPPRGNVLCFDNRGSGAGHLRNEAFVGHDTAVQVNFYQTRSVIEQFGVGSEIPMQTTSKTHGNRPRTH